MYICLQKCQIQEKAVQEVKLAIKPYYQNKDITKDEYKEIVRKAVEKASKDLLITGMSLTYKQYSRISFL